MNYISIKMKQNKFGNIYRFKNYSFKSNSSTFFPDSNTVKYISLYLLNAFLNIVSKGTSHIIIWIKYLCPFYICFNLENIALKKLCLIQHVIKSHLTLILKSFPNCSPCCEGEYNKLCTKNVAHSRAKPQGVNAY